MLQKKSKVKLLSPKKGLKRKQFHLSLRFKLAFPVLIFVSLLLFILFRTTFTTVQELVLERNESRLKAIAEVFAETVKVPLILKNQQVLYANIEWMAQRTDVLEIRVEDSGGITVGGETGNYELLPGIVRDPAFLGVRRIGLDTYAVAVPIRAHERKLGRVLIIFTQQGFESELRDIFEERFSVAFIMSLVLAFFTAVFTWFAIRPIIILKRTAQEILAGDLTARARIHTFDEISDLGSAFNEMVARLTRSLDNLRSRTEALEESEEKFRLIVENASDIIFTLTPDGDLVLLNKGFTGYSRDELLKEGFELFLSMNNEESRKKLEQALEEVARELKPVNNLPLTHVHRRHEGEVFYLTNLTPVLDHDGQIRMIQGVMRDVTELRRIEMMKESLIRDVAHELKTPTAKFEMAMNYFESEIKKNKEMKKYQEVVDMIKANTDRLMKTITSIMDLSRLESGMHQIETADLNLNEVLEEVCRDMDIICKERGLVFESALYANPLMMKGDHDMLYRLFVNLISNAAKFTKAGKITLVSSAHEQNVRVTIRDTGIGIEPEHLKQIFERFVQKTASSMGIGVGLTISKDIAVLHDGKIWAESEGLGKGATFQVEFPSIVV